MTVAIGLLCSDGAIVASDSMSASGSHGLIAGSSTKIHAMEHIPVVWTGSGAVYVIEEVEAGLKELDRQASSEPAVREVFTTPILASVRNNLAQTVRYAMKSAYHSALPHGPQQVDGRTGKHPFSSDFLFGGWANEVPYLLEVDAIGQLNWHMASRFYAVGTGGDFAAVARGLMAHYIGADLTVEEGLKIAYRTIETTCRVSSAFVRPPVQLAVVDARGQRIIQDELKEIEESVAGWLLLERETIRMTPGGDDGLKEEPPQFEETPTS